MRIIIPTMMWKRPEVFQFWCDQINELKKKVDAEFIVLAVGSEGDVSRKLAEDNGVIYIEHPNMPLGAKANVRMKSAMKYEWDYVLFLGSDDVVSADLINYYLQEIDGYDIIEVKDIYYFDTRSRTFVYCEGYTNHRKGEPLAPARFVKRKVFDEIGWHCWHNRKMKGIDGVFNKQLSRFKRKIISIKDRFLVLDIKTDDNISSWDMTRDNWNEIPKTFVKQKLGNNFEKLMQL